jgi:hypothetical protein
MEKVLSFSISISGVVLIEILHAFTFANNLIHFSGESADKSKSDLSIVLLLVKQCSSRCANPSYLHVHSQVGRYLYKKWRRKTFTLDKYLETYERFIIFSF